MTRPENVAGPSWWVRAVRIVLGGAVFAVLWALAQYLFQDRGRSFGACLAEGAVLGLIVTVMTPLAADVRRRWKARKTGPDDSR